MIVSRPGEQFLTIGAVCVGVNLAVRHAIDGRCVHPHVLVAKVVALISAREDSALSIKKRAVVRLRAFICVCCTRRERQVGGYVGA